MGTAPLGRGSPGMEPSMCGTPGLLSRLTCPVDAARTHGALGRSSVRSAFLLIEHASNAELFDEVRAALPEGRDWPAPGSTTRMVQVQDAAGRFFTVFEIAANGGSFRADTL